jgi:hypothetical protein
VRPLGALLFFLSLAYFLFAYLTTFGEIADGGSLARAVTWNGVLFTIFALHHSIFARTGVRDWVARTAPAVLERSIYVVVASLLFMAVIAMWQPVPGLAWRVDGAALWLFRFIQTAGIWLTIQSAAALDIRELSGLRPQASGLGPDTGLSREARGLGPFKTKGPYGWVRHPIYTGWFLFVWGALPMTNTRLTFAAISCAYLLIAIPFEERSMRALPGGNYDQYATSVRWRLLPGVF